MKHSEKTRQSLIMHYQKYPRLQIQDIFKYIYQSSFGCEHMVSSLKTSTDSIRSEIDNTFAYDGPLVEHLDGLYSRVHLSYLNHGLSAETLGKLFLKSSKTEPDGKSDLENKLNIVKDLVCANKLPFSINELEKSAQEWQSNGYPPLHHSDIFRKEYKPSYRVIANKYVPFLTLFAKLDKMLKNDSKIVAIDGGSASGKTTLGEMLKEIYDCTVFHTDDFFLRPEQRTPERYAEIGGNIDRERFLEEILIPLSKNQPVFYRRFDCSTMTLAPFTKVIPEKLVVIEGTYSMHPEFENYYDFSIFMDISPKLQKTRIAKRNSPQVAAQFYNNWIPLEQIYFSNMHTKNRCDMSIPILE